MTQVHRVLDATPCASLAEYAASGGGDALEGARAVDADRVIETLRASGLRGRGGAGFPTATKWASVRTNASAVAPTPVVINGAEGEPSTFKDRAILRANPYRVLEGALVACAVFESTELIVCLKASFVEERALLGAAVEEMRAAGWLRDVQIRFVDGPSQYLFGEETALLEVIDGRQPFPRVTPPWRRGIDEVGDGTAAHAALAGPQPSGAAPVLVNNVETFANVALIVRHGPGWFRALGTPDSPGTIVCTVVGDCLRHGVGEFAMGTPLSSVIDELGGGALPGRRIVAVLPGASSAAIDEVDLATPLTHEDMRAAGSALGSAGFLCMDDAVDPLAVAVGVSRFLSVESCGQCTPCKGDGLAITSLLGLLLEGVASDADVRKIRSRLDTVTNEARCGLAAQQQTVVRSLLARCDDLPAAGIASSLTDSDRAERLARTRVLSPLVDIVDGAAVYDDAQARKQPDWSFNAVDSGVYPAQLLQNVPSGAAGGNGQALGTVYAAPFQ